MESAGSMFAEKPEPEREKGGHNLRNIREIFFKHHPSCRSPKNSLFFADKNESAEPPLAAC